jgi:broad specificity phosphatase PhoE
MHVFVMRHGESEYNVLELCNDDPQRSVSLTETGRAQAERAAEQLRQVPLDHIMCSQLPRARETAEIVGRYHKAAVEPRVELNDIRSGCDGRPVAEYFRGIAHDRLNARVGDGETLLEHKRRIMRFMDDLAKAQRYRNLLLVAHEETLRVSAAMARNLSDETMIGLSFRNCEIMEFNL